MESLPTQTPSDASALADDVVRAFGAFDDVVLAPAGDPRISDELAISLFEEMVRIRRVDERLSTLQQAGRIGFHVGARGEEAAILGAAAALREQDFIFPSSREFGAALWRGMSLAAYVHHMFGNGKDPAKGRQMPDHYTAAPVRFASVSSPVGTQIVHATGYAWGAKIRKDDVVVLAYFGDGATSAADFHNGLAFAGVFKTPNVFFCRNNGWALSLPVEKQTASATLAMKGLAYGVPFVRVDGNDLFAVLKVTRDAVARAAAGHGPTLIEAVERRGASQSGDGAGGSAVPSTPAGQAAETRYDPLARVRRYLEARGLWNEKKHAELEARIAAELERAINDAERAAPPAADTLFEDVYARVPRHLREQSEAQKRR
jgi:2-oxoisovalerate dehydrogenase E1 component alpha subunit